MIAESVRRYLERRGASYRVVPHDPRFTAEETAHAVHVSGKRFAKAVLLRMLPPDDFSFVVAVLPAHEMVDLELLGAELGRPVAIATEEETVALFPGIEAGALPPLGDLACIPMVVDASLADAGTIVFHGGTLTDLVEMAWEDFAWLGPLRMLEVGHLRAA